MELTETLLQVTQTGPFSSAAIGLDCSGELGAFFILLSLASIYVNSIIAINNFFLFSFFSPS